MNEVINSQLGKSRSEYRWLPSPEWPLLLSAMPHIVLQPRPYLEVSLAQIRQRIWLCLHPCEHLTCTPSILTQRLRLLERVGLREFQDIDWPGGNFRRQDCLFQLCPQPSRSAWVKDLLRLTRMVCPKPCPPFLLSLPAPLLHPILKFPRTQGGQIPQGLNHSSISLW